MTPLEPARLQSIVLRCLEAPAACAAAAGTDELQALLALRARVQAALDGHDEEADVAERLCEALLAWPGVLHAAMFQMNDDGDLQLEAEQGRDGAAGLLLGALLQRSSRLLQAPLRHAFPGLLAAASGELVLLDTLEQAGDPALAETLRAHGAAQAIGIPVPADGPGMPRGALSLLLDSSRALPPEALEALQDCARLAALGLRLIESNRESEQLLARLTYVSTTDALTGVANRRHGEQLLEREVRHARRYRTPLALLSFDIDRFKAINDNYGHPVGDKILATVASVIRSNVRKEVFVARTGGEEFAVIVQGNTPEEVLIICERVRRALETRTFRNSRSGVNYGPVTISLGYSMASQSDDAGELYAKSDAALYHAKNSGRNRTVIYEDNMKKEYVSKSWLIYKK
jgi:diguanylate cyclase (GGDEF)-like protein